MGSCCSSRPPPHPQVAAEREGRERAVRQRLEVTLHFPPSPLPPFLTQKVNN